MLGFLQSVLLYTSTITVLPWTYRVKPTEHEGTLYTYSIPVISPMLNTVVSLMQKLGTAHTNSMWSSLYSVGMCFSVGQLSKLWMSCLQAQILMKSLETINFIIFTFWIYTLQLLYLDQVEYKLYFLHPHLHSRKSVCIDNYGLHGRNAVDNSDPLTFTQWVFIILVIHGLSIFPLKNIFLQYLDSWPLSIYTTYTEDCLRVKTYWFLT